MFMTSTLTYIIIAAGIATFILTYLFSKIIIPVLKSHKMGQKILDIGPRWHKSKEGTPTMGGIIFILASTLSLIGAEIAFALAGWGVPKLLTATFIYALANAFIGCVDDTAKLLRRQNEGLTARQKIALQIFVSLLYIAALVWLIGPKTDLYIPFVDTTIDLGWYYYAFALILLVGMVNSVNLADGIDGLASSEVLVVSLFYIAAAYSGKNANPSSDAEIALLGAVTAGCAAGFLIYNFHPARVFMGDTGSLFFGAIVVGGSFIMDNPLLCVVFGFMFVLESLSDIVQVLYFKATHGKRFFKMAPIHHHFEKCGWSENKVVAVFTLATLIFCVLSYFGLG